MKLVDIMPILFEVSRRNNLGTRALRDGIKMNCHEEGSLCFFDSAIADFGESVSVIRAALQAIGSIGSDLDKRNINISSFVSSHSTWAKQENKEEKQLVSPCDNCTSRCSGRTKASHRFSVNSLHKQNHRIARTNKVLVVQPSLSQSSPTTIEEEASNQSSSTGVLLEQRPQQERSQLQIPYMDLRNAILNEIDEDNNNLPCQESTTQSDEVDFVYDGSITIDPLELRKCLANVALMSTRLTARGERIDEGSLDQQDTADDIGILRDLLFRISVIVVYNLGLAYHLKSRRERAEFKQSSSSSALMASARSNTCLTSLQKAQVFYSMASRHITHLPSWKFKLVLLNNLGQVYWERNLRDNARRCFEAVCRHITKVTYQCSRSSILIPFSSVANGTIHHTSSDPSTEELLQALAIAALRKLATTPHAATA